MFASFVLSIVEFSRKFSLFLVLAALGTSLGLGIYVAKNISINTDINQLLSEDLPWRKQEKVLEKAFPQKVDTLVVMIDGEDGMKTEKAAAGLAEKLSSMPDTFSFVSRPDALPFFRTNGLLYLSLDELAQALDQMAQAQPMLGSIIGDPSLRGFFGTIGLMVQGIQAGAIDSSQIERPLVEIEKTLQATLSGEERFLNWHQMMPKNDNDPFASRELRKYIIAKPVLDYSSLQPGETASKALRQAATNLGLTPENGVRVRLTGSVPLNDDEFSSVSEGAGVSTLLCGLGVFALLFLAMRSWRIVMPITLTLIVGLIASTAFATATVGSLNLISVAFAVMFIGIAVDFGIQFGVRYRDEHSREPDHARALAKTAKVIGAPLAMAAGSTAIGFLAFVPTDYRGVSELGLIAGSSMIIAFLLNISLLPALMTLTKPPAETEAIGFSALAPLDDFMGRRKKIIIGFFAVLTLSALMIALHLRFDFDPLNLKDPAKESVSAMFEAMQDPDSDAYAAQILVSSRKEAQALIAKLEKLPEVDHTMTIDSFVPEQQEPKLAMIADTAQLLAPTFALSPQSKAGFDDNVEALRKTAESLRQAKEKLPFAEKLAGTIDSLASQASPELLARAQNNLLSPIQAKFKEMENVLKAQPVSKADIPQELVRDWMTQDEKFLIEVFPKRGADGNPRDPDILKSFVVAIQKIAPHASGTPISIQESGHTIISAFVRGGLLGLGSIAFLSFIVLRRFRDVVLLLTPLVAAGILTLATMVVLGLSLNFANIIALPLLFSLGVSYAVYFVFFARQGRRDFLQSSMARAVLFSASTVLIAFASLGFSSHLGTRGMGELLTISLIYSLLCTFFMLPVLCGFGKQDRLR